jgi:hypothetical protein
MVRVHDRQRLSLGCVTPRSTQRRWRFANLAQPAGARSAILADLVFLVAASNAFTGAAPTTG